MAKINEEIYDFPRLDIRKDMDRRHAFAAVIFGKRGTGKTVLLKDLLSQIYDWYAEAHLFSPTAQSQLWNFEYIDKENVYNGLDLDKLRAIMDKQKEYIQGEMSRAPKGVDLEEYKKKLKHIMIIFDDVIGDEKLRKSKEINDIFILGRHQNTCIVVLSQEVGGRNGLNRVSRNNTDLIITFYPRSEADRKLITEQFLSIESKKEGDRILRTVTQEAYHNLVILGSIPTIDPKDFLRVYMASEKVKKFKFSDNKKSKFRKGVIDPFYLSQLEREHPVLGSAFEVRYADDDREE